MVRSVAFNPDGGLLASGSADRTVRVVATSTWTEVTTLTQLSELDSVAFNPDGGLLASGSWDKTVKVFATSTWAEVTTLAEHTKGVTSVAFNPDGGLLASGSWDGTVKVFATSTWAEVRTLAEQTSNVEFVAFNPDGGLLACGSGVTVKVFATSTPTSAEVTTTKTTTTTTPTTTPLTTETTTMDGVLDERLFPNETVEFALIAGIVGFFGLVLFCCVCYFTGLYRTLFPKARVAVIPASATAPTCIPPRTRPRLETEEKMTKNAISATTVDILPGYWSHSLGLQLDIPDSLSFDQMVYVAQQNLAKFQELMDTTYRPIPTQDRPCPKGTCGKVRGGCPCVRPGGAQVYLQATR
ncbi:unnamed protein product [Polarella glacialis]|uniref:Uncharacterized protein n=1 Tax=Polarella glacialis TaxID=89957 RepID=A0A813L0B9_POLGL|nr:unnamed protein product [Polarella glacialis]